MQFGRPLVVVALLASCAGWTKNVDIPSRQCKELSKSFFKQSQWEMVDSLASLGLEMQYAIYLCGNQYIHPPIQGLVKPFAAQGRPVADLLRNKVATARSDLTVRDIVRAFVEMKRQQTFVARDDADLMRVLDARIESMKSPEWKAITREMYSEIAK